MFILDPLVSTPYPYGITSVVDIELRRGALRGHTSMGFCGHGVLSYPFDCERVWDKEDTTERVNTDGVTFSTLTMETCSTVGNDGENHATKLTELQRSHALEQAFVDFFGTAATKIGTGPYAPKVALAVATQYAATQMPGRPILHMQAALADLIGGIERHGNHLETHSGIPVSAGTGYDDAEWPATTRIWVTGPGRILQDLAHEGSQVNPEKNEITNINETAYSMSFECLIAYVEVSIT